MSASPPHPTPPSPTPVPGQARRELVIVAGLTLLAAVPRFLRFGQEGLTHFDEGVYAFAGLWSVSPKGLAGIDPGVIPYAPPGLPILIGLAYTVFGVADVSALFVTAACGVLTVPVAAWLGRRTFGPGGGAASAVFAAFSLAHVAFSRKALTDVPFLIAWLAAVGLGGWFLERPRFGRALAFGVAVGLAQNVKYNGWVAGVVVAAAAVFGLFTGRDARRPSAVVRTFGLGLVAALVAGLVYLPWYLFVEAHGGYAALLKHHRSYLGGASSWLPHWDQQLAQVVALSGGAAVGAVTWSVAWVVAGAAVHGFAMLFPKSRWDAARLRLGLLIGAAVLATVPDLGWWVGLGWSGWLLFDPRPARRVLGSWWLILSVMTPFYHPYARLWLPLHAAGWVLLTGGLLALGPFPGSVLEVADRTLFRNRRLIAQAAVAVTCLVAARTHWGDSRPRALPLESFFAPTDGFRNAAAELANDQPVASDPAAVLRVLARRPLLYYLALQGKPRIQMLPDADELVRGPLREHEWALVDGVQVGEGTDEGTEWRRIERRWVRVSVWPVVFDPVTLLDVNPEAPYDLSYSKPASLVLFYPRGQKLPASLTPPTAEDDGPDPAR